MTSSTYDSANRLLTATPVVPTRRPARYNRARFKADRFNQAEVPGAAAFTYDANGNQASQVSSFAALDHLFSAKVVHWFSVKLD